MNIKVNTKGIFFLLAVGCTVTVWKYSYSQVTDYIKLPSLGVHFFYNNFTTSEPIKAKGMEPGLAINYLNGLTERLDLSATLSASFTDYPFKAKMLGQNKALLELDAMIYGKILSDKHSISPYLSAGVGISRYSDYYGAFLPVGTGVQFSVRKRSFIYLNAQYRARVIDKASSHFYYSIGITGNIVRKKKRMAKDQSRWPASEIVPESTIADRDTDNDGIPDKDDQCPTIPGLARYGGCPIPDRDGDGVNDEMDVCPDLPGPASNRGCPARGPVNRNILTDLEYATRNIFFTTASAELLPVSHIALDRIVHLLNAAVELKIIIQGHTDNQGSKNDNQLLSCKRAESVKDYLIGKDIAAYRLKTEGYGQEQPIAENSTSEGRAKNRRVVFKINY